MVLSEKVAVTSGVPQGNVVGPLLFPVFQIFIDDIHDNMHKTLK